MWHATFVVTINTFWGSWHAFYTELRKPKSGFRPLQTLLKSQGKLLNSLHPAALSKTNPQQLFEEMHKVWHLRGDNLQFTGLA